MFKANQTRKAARMVERRDFAFKLASLLNQNKPVIFADEATYGPWHKYSVVRTWVDSK